MIALDLSSTSILKESDVNPELKTSIKNGLNSPFSTYLGTLGSICGIEEFAIKSSFSSSQMDTRGG